MDIYNNINLETLKNTYLKIAGAIDESIVDGPGFRYTIFTQGCPFRCKGCHNEKTQSMDGGVDVPLYTLYEEIQASTLCKGVTFSGGEPFIQADKLINLAYILKQQNYNLWIYSGFKYEQIILDPIKKQLLSLCDVLVDGPFILEQKSYDLLFRGSKNQRLIDIQKSLANNQIILFNN